ncbi:MAG: non-heme iron oxygenase ferredoxin subunit [Dehalococcoidia bacterium]
MEDGFSKVASLADVPDGEMKAVNAPDGVQVAIANIKGELFCFENMCTHEDASLNFGWVLSDICQIECPLHEGRFDPRTGAATQAPAEYALKTYNIRVEGDDILVGPKKS